MLSPAAGFNLLAVVNTRVTVLANPIREVVPVFRTVWQLG
jgi:hypothetical protein